MGRKPKSPSHKQASKLMLYLTKREKVQLESLAIKSGRHQADLARTALRSAFAHPEVFEMQYPEYRDNSSKTDGSHPDYILRKDGEFFPEDPVKVIEDTRDQRGVIQRVEGRVAWVKFDAQDDLEPIPFEQLVYWDDEDESWIHRGRPAQQPETVRTPEGPISLPTMVETFWSAGSVTVARDDAPKCTAALLQQDERFAVHAMGDYAQITKE